MLPNMVALSRIARASGRAAVCLGCMALFPDAAQGQGEGNSRSCLGDHAAPVRLSEDSLGLVALSASIRSLRVACPLARDTSLPGPTVTRSYPGLVLPAGRLTVVAVQYSQPSLESERPPDGWIIAGRGAFLSPGVRLDSPWATLHNGLGPAQAMAQGVLVVRFCSLPRMLFTLNAKADKSGLADLARIPSGTTVHHVFIIGRHLGSALGPCP